MAVRTVSNMRRCIDKRIRMTRGAVIRAGCCYQAAVIWCCCMDRAPRSTVTRGTVAADCKVFAYRCARQGTVTRMTVGTGVMRHRISAYQRWWITMTAGAIRSCYLHQGCMIWLNRSMRGLPTRGMTRLAVAANCKGFADRIADQSTGAGVMAVGAVSQMCGCIDKCIRMTRGAVIGAGSRY